MAKKVHCHTVMLEEDLANDFPLPSFVSDTQDYQDVVKDLIQLFDEEYKDGKGYSIYLGAIPRMPNQAYLDLYTKSNIKSAIPKDLFDKLLSVNDALTDIGFNSSVNDVIRFNLWMRYPNTIAPNGDLLTSEIGWLPPVIRITNINEEQVEYEVTSSTFCKSVGMKHCDRVTRHYVYREELCRELVTSLNKGGWKSSFGEGSTTLWNEAEIHAVKVKVLKEVKDNEGNSELN